MLSNLRTVSQICRNFAADPSGGRSSERSASFSEVDSGKPKTGNYDFWAVGKNCCNDPPGKPILLVGHSPVRVWERTLPNLLLSAETIIQSMTGGRRISAQTRRQISSRLSSDSFTSSAYRAWMMFRCRDYSSYMYVHAY